MTDYINEPGVWFDSKGKCIDINDVKIGRAHV